MGPHGHVSVDVDPEVAGRRNWLHVSGANADRTTPFKSFCTKLYHDLRGSPNGDVNCKGYEKIAIFDQYLILTQKWYKIELYLQWQTNSKSYMINQTVPLSTTPIPGFKVTPLFETVQDRHSFSVK